MMACFYTIKNTVNVGSDEWERTFWLTKRPAYEKTPRGSSVWGTAYNLGFDSCYATESAAKAALTRYRKLYPTEGIFEMCRGYYSHARDSIVVYKMYDMEV